MSRRRIVIVMSATPPPDHGHLVHALRSATDNIEQQLAQSSVLKPGEVAIITYVALHQPATIPEVAAGVGHGYRWAQDVLADQGSSLVGGGQRT